MEEFEVRDALNGVLSTKPEYVYWFYLAFDVISVWVPVVSNSLLLSMSNSVVVPVI